MSKSRLFLTAIVVYHVVMLAGLAVYVNAQAQDLVTGDQPWCATDGYIFECYYYTPRRCESAVELSRDSRWCERNPGLYQSPRRRNELRWWQDFPDTKEVPPWELYKREGWHGAHGDI